jgi:hypothetical protein
VRPSAAPTPFRRADAITSLGVSAAGSPGLPPLLRLALVQTAVILLIAIVVLRIAFHLDTPFFTGTERRKRFPNAAIGNWFNCVTNGRKILRIRVVGDSHGR